MPENRQGKNNAVPYSSADNIEEAIWRLKIQNNENQEGGVAQPNNYPDRPGEPDCIYYLRTGLCGYGSNCRFNHPTYAAEAAQYRGELPERVGQPDCGYFLKTGTCKYGSACKYHHPRDRHGAGPVSFNIIGLPMRQEEKSCPYYMRTGSCKFGSACKFHHPQPASPVTGPTALTSTGSGLPYVGGLPAWPLQRSPYLSGQRVQSPQTYMPVVLSPSQGVLPTQGWNTYLGNMSPLSSTSILGSNLAYNSRNHGESGSSGQVHLLSGSIPNFPDRPDQPECRYFMNTGTCKYGSDCKYHHPKERIAQIATNSVGPLGLPLRPGQAVCSHYSMYGLCKYGPTCKFDHPPMTGYSYSYPLSMPSLSMLDPSQFYQRNSTLTIRSSETSPSKSSRHPEGGSESSDAKDPNQVEKQSGSPPEAQGQSD